MAALLGSAGCAGSQSSTTTAVTTTAVLSTTTSTSVPTVVELTLTPEDLSGEVRIEANLADSGSPLHRDDLTYPWSFLVVGDRVYWIDGTADSVVVFDLNTARPLDRIMLPQGAAATDLAAVESGQLVVTATINGEGFLIRVDPDLPTDIDLFASERVKYAFLNSRLMALGDDVYIETGSPVGNRSIWAPVLVGDQVVDHRDKSGSIEMVPGVEVTADAAWISIPGYEWTVRVPDLEYLTVQEADHVSDGVVYLLLSGVDPNRESRQLLVELEGSAGRAWEIGFLPGDYTRRLRVMSDGAVFVAVAEGDVLRLIELVH